MRPELLSVPGVVAINYIDPTFDNKTRAMTVRFEVDTESDDTVEDTLSQQL